MKRSNDNRKKSSGIVLLLLLVVGISIGYAALTTTLNINGDSTIGKASWDVHFDNVQVTDGSVDGANVTKAAAIDSGDTTKVNYSITLAKPGDFYEFTVDVVNNGTLDAKLSATPTLTGVSTEQEAYTNYTITYDDNSSIVVGDTSLIAGKTDSTTNKKTVKVRIEYKKDITASQLPTEDQALNLEFSMNYVQG